MDGIDQQRLKVEVAVGAVLLAFGYEVLRRLCGWHIVYITIYVVELYHVIAEDGLATGIEAALHLLPHVGLDLLTRAVLGQLALKGGAEPV